MYKSWYECDTKCYSNSIETKTFICFLRFQNPIRSSSKQNNFTENTRDMETVIIESYLDMIHQSIAKIRLYG